MQCVSCGTALQPGMSNCPRCGAPIPLNAPPPSSPGGNTNSTIPADFGQFRETASYAGQPYIANPPSYLPPAPQAFLAPQPLPKQRHGLSKGMLILLVILVLLVIVGSSIVYYFSIPYPAQIRAQATATAQAQANAVATATAHVIQHENATATAQAQATLTAQQNIYDQATSGIPAVTDSLANNSQLNWSQHDSANNGGCIFTGGMYHVKELDTGYFQPCFAQSSNFSNFTLQVQMTIFSGEFGGLIFRADSQNPKFYLLQIGTASSYELFTYFNNSGNNSKTLLTSYSSAIKGLNQPNLLTLIARGNQLTLFVNKHYVDTVSNGTYKTGQIGFIAYDKTISSDVAFSNLQIWKL